MLTLDILMEQITAPQSDDDKTLDVVDYILIALLMLASIVIGAFYAIKDRNETNTAEYLVGGRNLHPLPVALSLVASYMSAISILGLAMEAYFNGSVMLYISIAYATSIFTSSQIYAPVFFNAKVSSANEYLSQRFGKSIRILCSVLAIVQYSLYMALVIYAPALVLAVATGLELHASILTVGLVGTLYTAVGGIKAVIWTDVLQSVIMIIGLLIIIIIGSEKLGGIGEVIRINNDGGRYNFNNFNPDPTERHTFWTLVIGGHFAWSSVYSASQSQIQRYVSLRSVRDVKISLWINFIGLEIFLFAFLYTGMICYAHYVNCDPYSTHKIKIPDQILAYYVMDVLNDYFGVPGLFVAVIFSGGLSTVSSGINALGTLLMEDIVKSFIDLGNKEIYVLKAIVVAFGLLSLGLAYGINVLHYPKILQGVFIGAILGIIPAIICVVLSLMFPFSYAKLKLNHDGCSYPLPTHNPNVTTIQAPTPNPRHAYHISYLYYSLFISIPIVILSVIVSFAVGRNDPKKVNPNHMYPLFYKITCCLPNHIRQKFLFGVPYNGEYGVYLDGVDKGQGPKDQGIKGAAKN